MSEVHFNGPLTICSGIQYRIRLEIKLRKLLGEDIIIGPMDASIRRCVESGEISEEVGGTLLEVSKFSDMCYTVPEFDPPSEETIKRWSDVIDSL